MQLHLRLPAVPCRRSLSRTKAENCPPYSLIRHGNPTLHNRLCPVVDSGTLSACYRLGVKRKTFLKIFEVVLWNPKIDIEEEVEEHMTFRERNQGDLDKAPASKRRVVD